ncbi:hypothetical protein U1Q18_006772 [Sarracenia purpurea var. burkii]
MDFTFFLPFTISSLFHLLKTTGLEARIQGPGKFACGWSSNIRDSTGLEFAYRCQAMTVREVSGKDLSSDKKKELSCSSKHSIQRRQIQLYTPKLTLSAFNGVFFIFVLFEFSTPCTQAIDLRIAFPSLFPFNFFIFQNK